MGDGDSGEIFQAEAAKAAEAVRALSGWTGMDGGTAQRTDLPAGNTAGDSAGAGEAADTGASSEASDGTAGEAAAHGTDTDKKAAFPAEASDGRAPDNGRSRGQITQRTGRTKARADRTHMRRTRRRKSDLPSCR